MALVLALARVIVGVPLQLSVAATGNVFAAGTRLAHVTVTSFGKVVITGAVVSFTVMTWFEVVMFPQRSVAVNVRTRVNRFAQVRLFVESEHVTVTVPTVY